MEKITLDEINQKMLEIYKSLHSTRNVMIDYNMMNDTQKRIFDQLLAEEANNFMVPEKNIKKS